MALKHSLVDNYTRQSNREAQPHSLGSMIESTHVHQSSLRSSVLKESSVRAPDWLIANSANESRDRLACRRVIERALNL